MFVFRYRRPTFVAAAILATGMLAAAMAVAAADLLLPSAPRSLGELDRTAIIRLGKTADWVVVTADAVWVGSTGPDAVHRIDPKTNKRVASVRVPGEPCAGLVAGFGSLWIPLCGKSPALAKVNLSTNHLTDVFKIGPAGAESGITTSPDSVWLVIDKVGTLARIDPSTGAILRRIRIPTGSYNPHYSEGQVWVTQADGAAVTSVDATSGEILASVPTGPGPRFLTSGAGAVWTLNQGDGSVTRIDTGTKQASKTIPLGIPGHGGDISFGGAMVWTTVSKVPLSLIDARTATLLCQWVGPGGDSLGIGEGAIWLTDYHAGTISRIELDDAVARCGRQ